LMGKPVGIYPGKDKNNALTFTCLYIHMLVMLHTIIKNFVYWNRILLMLYILHAS
jgi:hypothetical protein